MTITPVQLIPMTQITASIVTYYTSTNIKTRWDKLSATNVDTNPHTITIYLVPNGSSAGAANTLTLTRSIAAKTTWNAPDIVGHIQNPGDFLAIAADAASVVNVAAAGVQISS